MLFGVEVANPEIPRWAALHVFAASALFVAWKGFNLPKSALWGIGFFCWAGLSLLWSDDWRGGAVEMTNGLGLLAVFLVAACSPRDVIERAARIVAPVLVIGAAVLCFVFPQWFGGFGNENFQFEFIAILLPFLMIVRGRVWVAVSVIGALAGLYLLATTPSNLKWLLLGAFGLAGLVWIYRQGFPWAAWIIGAGGLVIALATGIAGPNMMGSVNARLELTLNTLAMWLASPFWGHGVGSFNVEYPNFQERHFALFPEIGTVFGADMSYFAGAAHNEYAQVLADYGVIGAILIGGLAYSLVFAKRRDFLDLAAKVSMSVVAVLCLVQFPMQNPYTAALAAFGAGVLLNGRAGVRVPKFAVLAAVPGVAAMAVISVLTFQSYKLFSITETIVAENPYYGLLANFAAYQTFPWPRHIRNQLAISLNVAIAKEPDSIRIDPGAADLVYDIARVSSGRATSIELGRIEYLLMSGRWQDRRDEIEDRLYWLKQNASKHAAVWLVEGKWALLLGDKPRAMTAARTAQALPNQLLNYRDYIATIMAAAQ